MTFHPDDQNPFKKAIPYSYLRNVRVKCLPEILLLILIKIHIKYCKTILGTNGQAGKNFAES